MRLVAHQSILRCRHRLFHLLLFVLALTNGAAKSSLTGGRQSGGESFLGNSLLARELTATKVYNGSNLDSFVDYDVSPSVGVGKSIGRDGTNAAGSSKTNVNIGKRKFAQK